MTLSLDTAPRPARVQTGARRPAVLREPLLAHLALAGILGLAAALLLWQLPDNGWGNAYYADATRAAARSWPAFWTASLDVSRSVSLDKTPLAIWMMALSARAFGFTPAALLVPNALCVLGSVALLNTLVRRAFGTGAGLMAALFLAVTPAMVAVGRFDNPDALLVLLLLSAAYAGTRAIETGRMPHAIACGVWLGLAFNTKMLQAYLIVPALLAAAAVTGRAGRRMPARVILAATLAMAAVSVAWIGAMSLLPAGARPWVGDTTTNSWWQLVLGANGVGRIGSGVLGVGGGSSAAAPLRLLQAPAASQIAWLLPLAVAGAVAGGQIVRRRERSPRARSAVALWTGWAVVHIVVFSLLGLFHAYYTSALAPAIAALAAVGACELWRRRGSATGAVSGCVVLAVSVGLAIVLHGDAPGFLPWLGPVTAGMAALGAGLALLPVRLRRARGLYPAAGVALLAALLVGPAAYSWATTQRQLGGIDPLAGPGRPGDAAWTSAQNAGRAGLIRWLMAHQGRARYLAAVDGSLAGAPIALLSGRPVLIMGGFAGSDPAPSTDRLGALIRSGQVSSIVLSGKPVTANGATSTGLGGAQARAVWVRRHCRAVALAPTIPAPNGQLTTRVYRCRPSVAPSPTSG